MEIFVGEYRIDSEKRNQLYDNGGTRKRSKPKDTAQNLEIKRQMSNRDGRTTGGTSQEDADISNQKSSDVTDHGKDVVVQLELESTV